MNVILAWDQHADDNLQEARVEAADALERVRDEPDLTDEEIAALDAAREAAPQLPLGDPAPRRPNRSAQAQGR